MPGGAPAVAALIEVDGYALPPEVENIRRSGPVGVSQANALGLELIGFVEPGRRVHRNFGAEPTITEIGPVADLAVADAREIREPVAGHVGEMNGLGIVREHDARASPFVERRWNAIAAAEP